VPEIVTPDTGILVPAGDVPALASAVVELAAILIAARPLGWRHDADSKRSLPQRYGSVVSGTL